MATQITGKNAPNLDEGLLGSSGLSAEINTLKDKMQELIQSTSAILPLKGAVSELLDLKNSFTDIKAQILEQGHARQDEVSDIKRTLDDLNECIESMTQEAEEHALEVETSRREMRGDIQSLRQNLTKEIANREEQHTKVWIATQDLMTSFQESTEELSKQYLEWQDYKDEAQRDFERSRKILDYLLIHSFEDPSKTRESILAGDTGESNGAVARISSTKLLGERSGDASPSSPTANSPRSMFRRRGRADTVISTTGDTTPERDRKVTGYAGLLEMEAKLSGLSADLEALSVESKREYAKFYSLAADLESLSVETARFQKEHKSLSGKFMELESEVIRKPQFDVLKKDAAGWGIQVQSIEQEVSNLSAKLALQRQELTEVSEREEQHASEVKRKLQAATQSMAQGQSDLQAELQQRLKSHASSISDVNGHPQSQLSSLAEKPLSTTLTSDADKAVHNFDRRISGLYEQVNLILQQDTDLERRFSGVWEQVNLISQKDFITKKEFVEVVGEVWEAIAANQSSEESQADITKNHQMLWEAIIQLQMKQHEDARWKESQIQKPMPHGPSSLTTTVPSREDTGPGGLSSGGSSRALNADPRSGSHTPLRAAAVPDGRSPSPSQMPPAQSTGSQTVIISSPTTGPPSIRSMRPEAKSPAGSRPPSRDISPQPAASIMRPGGYPQLITQHAPLQNAAPASPGIYRSDSWIAAPVSAGIPPARAQSPGRAFATYSPRVLSSPNGALNARLINGTGS